MHPLQVTVTWPDGMSVTPRWAFMQYAEVTGLGDAGRLMSSSQLVAFGLGVKNSRCTKR